MTTRISACAVVGEDMLAKYNLQLNSAYLASPEQLAIFPELVAKYQVQYIAGGATQNSIRVAQWMIQKPKATTFVGCVGKDEFGAKLRACAEADGVTVHYLEDDTTPTGSCAVLVNKAERCLGTIHDSVLLGHVAVPSPALVCVTTHALGVDGVEIDARGVSLLFVCVWLAVCLCLCMHVCIHVCIYVCVCVCVCMC
jgi:hypothetical protein